MKGKKRLIIKKNKLASVSTRPEAVKHKFVFPPLLIFVVRGSLLIVICV